MDFFMLIIKSVFSLFALFILTSALGKKQINQLNMFDYVIGISIGNVVAEMTINKEVIFLDGIIVMAIYSLISICNLLRSSSSFDKDWPMFVILKLLSKF